MAGSENSCDGSVYIGIHSGFFDLVEFYILCSGKACPGVELCGEKGIFSKTYEGKLMIQSGIRSNAPGTIQS